ncbi:hypothetical protein FOVSG1_002352 [Fusarium oxysporum f. sp. vasinfectum]
MSPDLQDPANRRASCDQCRQKKLKCDGSYPSCGRCSTLGEPCKFSARMPMGRPKKRKIASENEAQESSASRTSPSTLAMSIGSDTGSDMGRRASFDPCQHMSEDTPLDLIPLGNETNVDPKLLAFESDPGQQTCACLASLYLSLEEVRKADDLPFPARLSVLRHLTTTAAGIIQCQAVTDVSGLLPPEHWAEVAEELGDTDSALGDDTAESTASITSSILQYRNINGRTYHRDIGNAQYWGTNDEKQNESMDINHHVLTLLLDGALYLAPIPKDIKNAIDIGTGTGIWAIDFADNFPDAQVIGTDVSPIQPGWIPPNLRFDIEDCTQEWTFAPNSQDYIHFRWLVGSIVDWDQLFKEAYRCLKPGGYIESHEALSRMDCDDGTITEKSAMHQWGKFFVEGGKKIGRSFTIVEDGVQRSAMEKAGFVNLVERDFKVPIGGWPKDPKMKEIGKYAQATLEQDIEGYVLFMANTVEGWTKEEVEVYISMLRRELRQGNMHPYYWQKVVWAQKPKKVRPFS